MTLEKRALRTFGFPVAVWALALTAVPARCAADVNLDFAADLADVTGFVVALLGLVAGDLNCDGFLDARDLGPFSLAVLDPTGYATAFPRCYLNLADLNGDGIVDPSDIGPLVQLLLGP